MPADDEPDDDGPLALGRRGFLAVSARGAALHDRRTSASACDGRATRPRPTRPRRACADRRSAAPRPRPARPPETAHLRHAAARSPAAWSASTGSRRATSVGRRPRPAATSGTDVPISGRVEFTRVRLPADHRRLRRARRARRRSRARRSTARSATSIVVHFRNGDDALRPGAHDAPARRALQPRVRRRVPRRLHPRRRLRRARARSSPTPGSARPTSVGVWPYHDHGPNHTLNTFRGLFGAIIVREKGEKAPDVEQSLVPPRAAAAGHRPAPPFQCINGRAYAGNTPTITAKVGQDVAMHVFGMRQRLPRLPRPRPPLEGRRRGASWTRPIGRARTRRSPPASSRTTPAAGCTTATSSPTRTAGWRAGTWSSPSRTGEQPHVPSAAIAGPLVLAALGVLAGARAAAAAADYPPPTNPTAGQTKPRGPLHTLKVCAQGQEGQGLLQDDPEGRRQGQGRRHDQGRPTAPTARACGSSAPRSATCKLVGNVEATRRRSCSTASG